MRKEIPVHFVLYRFAPLLCSTPLLALSTCRQPDKGYKMQAIPNNCLLSNFKLFNNMTLILVGTMVIVKKFSKRTFLLNKFIYSFSVGLFIHPRSKSVC